MSILAWSEELALEQPQIDATHREFVQHLQSTAASLGSPEPQWLAHYDALLQHTIDHFAQEERWMHDIGFSPENCHARQHASVLQAMREVREQLQAKPDAALLRQLLLELGQWFSLHARSMDAALCETIHAAGYDPASGTCERRIAPDAPARYTCGNSSCA